MKKIGEKFSKIGKMRKKRCGKKMWIFFPFLSIGTALEMTVNPSELKKSLQKAHKWANREKLKKKNSLEMVGT